LVLLLAACSSGGGAPRAGSGGGSAPVRASNGSCSQADLDGPALEMPTPRRVTAPLVLRGGIVARLDPEPGISPVIKAGTIWRLFTQLDPVHARSAQLLIGAFRAYLPYGQSGPKAVDVFAWVLVLHHLAYPIPASAKTQGDRGGQPPVCEFVDAFLVRNATTSAAIVYSY
jgi:hypothetical protein